MPFDPAPREVQVGEFQKYADAMLRGCAVSGPSLCSVLDAKGNSCAAGAIALGLGLDLKGSDAFGDWWQRLGVAYHDRYATSIVSDNDRGRFTREQIAARIAAL